ncbi:MAG TPA: hypothetical protein VG538_14050 [Vicinamibacterales bacterium]|nr:hypothetical protein [Vicinamibacterales bacterium]
MMTTDGEPLMASADAVGPSAVPRALLAAALVVWAVVFLAVYVPRVGHGFVQDDFAWIASSRIAHLSDIARIFRSDNGFYRPVVALTFAADRALFGLRPFGYGLTNLLLALACAGAIAWLARGLALRWPAAVFAGALWLLNPHGLHWALLWTSGRTALLLSLFAALTAAAVVRGRLALAGVFFAAALLSKEEAVVVGAVFTAWLWIRPPAATRGGRVARPMAWTAIWIVILGAYCWARSGTGAMTPWTAPAYYAFTSAPAAVLRNLLEYLDRASTFAVAAAVVALVLLRPARWRPAPAMSRALVCCGLWIAGGLAITVFLPVRSDLYACLPSIGTCLAAAIVVDRAWTWSTHAGRRRAVVVAAIVPIALYPMYVSRSARWVSLADLSTRVLDELPSLTADLPDGSTVILHDDVASRATLSGAFGVMLNDAWNLEGHHPLVFWLDSRPNRQPRPCASCAARSLRLVGGRLVRDAAAPLSGAAGRTR